jgi:hypothetical protein
MSVLRRSFLSCPFKLIARVRYLQITSRASRVNGLAVEDEGVPPMLTSKLVEKLCFPFRTAWAIRDWALHCYIRGADFCANTPVLRDRRRNLIIAIVIATMQFSPTFPTKQKQ